MDVNELRITITVLSFLVFLGIVGWTVARRNKARFDEAAQLPFVAEEARTEARTDRGGT